MAKSYNVYAVAEVGVSYELYPLQGNYVEVKVDISIIKLTEPKFHLGERGSDVFQNRKCRCEIIFKSLLGMQEFIFMVIERIQYLQEALLLLLKNIFPKFTPNGCW